MEQKEKNLEETPAEQPSMPEVKPKPKFNAKILIFGLPIFVVQLIAVYFITANILIKKMDSRTVENAAEETQTETHTETADKTDTSNQNYGEHIFLIEDIIVNPANTKGEQLLLTSVAFDVPDETIKQSLYKKQILVKDQIISVLSSKSIDQLSNIEYKDSLRTEISNKVQAMFAELKINKVYFSKYIIN